MVRHVGGKDRGSGQGSRSGVLPVVYLTVAFVVAAAVLPTALRPPPEESTQSAELSPDAPPDDAPEAIIQSLQQAGSRTAGATGTELAADEPAPPPPPPPPPPSMAPTRGQCYGDPPRQVESLYAPPCVPAFTGDNGGATYHGVTAEEVRVAFITCAGDNQTTYDGLVPHEPPSDGLEDARDRTMRVLQQYFNTRYELYGRRLQFVSIRPDSDQTSGPLCDAASFRRAVIEADEVYGPIFGVISENAGAQAEAVERGLVTGGLYGAFDFYERHDPLVHSWVMDGKKLTYFGNEFLCKQVVGRPVSYTDDPLLAGQPRRLGLILFQGEVHNVPPEFIQEDLERRCGARYEQVILMNLYDNSRNQTFATAIAQMKAAGITTLNLAMDFLTAGLLTHQATQQSYFPEWIVCGCGEIDRNELVQTFFDTRQWGHAFGITAAEIARPQQATEWYRAYKSIEPDTTPDESLAKYYFHHILQFVNGIQMAGPELTPRTFTDGLRAIPHRRPEPRWSIGGGYGPGDWTYADYVSLVWFDPDEEAVDEGNNLGAYRHLLGGQRFALGEIPEGDLGWFTDGISQPPPEDLY